MPTKKEKTTAAPKAIQIKLTEDQKKDLIKFIQATGEANLDVGLVFDADINRGTIAPSTFMVGAAV